MPEREPTPQAATKRHAFAKPKVQEKPTRKQKRDFKKLAEQTIRPLDMA